MPRERERDVLCSKLERPRAEKVADKQEEKNDKRKNRRKGND